MQLYLSAIRQTSSAFLDKAGRLQARPCPISPKKSRLIAFATRAPSTLKRSRPRRAEETCHEDRRDRRDRIDRIEARSEAQATRPRRRRGFAEIGRERRHRR